MSWLSIASELPTVPRKARIDGSNQRLGQIVRPSQRKTSGKASVENHETTERKLSNETPSQWLPYARPSG